MIAISIHFLSRQTIAVYSDYWAMAARLWLHADDHSLRDHFINDNNFHVWFVSYFEVFSVFKFSIFSDFYVRHSMSEWSRGRKLLSIRGQPEREWAVFVIVFLFFFSFSLFRWVCNSNCINNSFKTEISEYVNCVFKF